MDLRGNGDVCRPVSKTYRDAILCQLRRKSKVGRDPFMDIFRSYGELLDSVTELKLQSDRLRKEGFVSAAGQQNEVLLAEIEKLKQENSRKQEELTELYRRRSENSQALLDATGALQRKEAENERLKAQLVAATKDDAQKKIQIANLKETLIELQKTIDLQSDEYIALQATFNSMDEKYRRVQDENCSLVERWREEKQKEVDSLNKENDQVMQRRQSKLRQDIRDAANKSVPEFDSDKFEIVDPSAGATQAMASVCVGSVVPTLSKLKFEAHDAEVPSVKWSPLGRGFATGGGDRRLKLWEITNHGKQKCIALFAGCNQTVMSIDFDLEGTHVLAASNDNIVRFWSIRDQRLRHTLAGHSNKVHAARFLVGTASGVISGSYDRTLKLWDLRNGACTRTMFAGSICNDLVTSEGPGANIISGHFDKKLRFWDSRQDRASEFVIGDKVTSLKLSSDRNFVLASCRDDRLYYIDLRMNRTLREFYAEGCRLVYDYTRCDLSPDDRYCAIGSADGCVYTWNVLTGAEESVLRAHNATVLACSWDPSGQCLITVDKEHIAVLWSAY